MKRQKPSAIVTAERESGIQEKMESLYEEPQPPPSSYISSSTSQTFYFKPQIIQSTHYNLHLTSNPHPHKSFNHQLPSHSIENAFPIHPNPRHSHWPPRHLDARGASTRAEPAISEQILIDEEELLPFEQLRRGSPLRHPAMHRSRRKPSSIF